MGLHINHSKFCFSGVTRWAVQFIGPPEEAKKFSFKLEFNFPNDDSPNGKESTIFKSPCWSAPEKGTFNEHYCVYAHRSFFDAYCDLHGDLLCKVKIYSTDKEENETVDGNLQEPSMEVV